MTKLFTNTCLLFCLFFLVINKAWSQDLTLWYKQPAVKWTEALPIGNGRIGAMVFGGVGQDRIQFNEETLWTGEPRNYNKPSAYKYLDSIRKLLFEGKQLSADALAEKEFLGLKSNEGNRELWVDQIKMGKGIKGNPALENFDDSKWKLMQVPSYEGWEVAGFQGLDGAVWLRTSFTLPIGWEGKEITLDLNRIRDHDFTYVNGKLIGTQENTEPRKYLISKEILHPGKNTLAIQVLNYFDKGGIVGYKDTALHIGLFPVGDHLNKISLNGQWKYFIQNDDPPTVGSYQASYQPFGDLNLQFKDTANYINYKRSLDLKNAIATTSYTANGIDFSRSYFVSQPNQLLAIHLTASKMGSVNFEAAVSSPHRNFSVKKINSNTISLSVKVRNGILRGESYLQVVVTGGKINVVDNKLVIENANEATLYLAAGTNYKNYKDVSANPVEVCTKALQSIAGKSYAQIRATHNKEYQQYFSTLSIDLGKSGKENLPTDERIDQFSSSSDPSFVALYLQYGRYLLISSSRPGTRPANLQGIWNDLLTPPWGGKYTTNINAQMNYWPAELLNLSPTHTPLFDMIEELRQSGRQTAKAYYNAPGWVLHHNTDIWRGTAPINAANHGIWVSGGAWLTQHLWEHYSFTQDIAFLRNKAYPIMKEAAAFFDHFLVKDPVTGWLVSSPSCSPEQGGLVAGPTMDHQIIRNLFKNVIEASRLLNVDKIARENLEKKYQQIAPNKIGKFGQLQEWIQDIDDTTNKHRHVSHLWGQYPGNEINWDETPELMKAARQSLLYRGDAATGWSLGWKINLWARFKDGNHAFNMIKLLISPAEKNGAGSYPNLFDAHPPFQIDGNFGGAAGIAEMLLQSQTKFIDLLPALPDGLPNGLVKGLCARGGFVLNVKWREGKLVEVEILSKAGKDCNIRYNGNVVNLPTQKGKKYTLNGDLKRI